MKHVQVKSYDAGAYRKEELYLVETQQEAIDRFREDHPEEEDCIVIAEDYKEPLGLIDAQSAKMMSALIEDKETFGNMHTLLGAIARGDKACTIFLGVELSEKEANKKMQQLRDAGFKVYNYDVSTESGGFREPKYKHPAEHRVDIAWY